MDNEIGKTLSITQRKIDPESFIGNLKRFVVLVGKKEVIYKNVKDHF